MACDEDVWHDIALRLCEVDSAGEVGCGNVTELYHRKGWMDVAEWRMTSQMYSACKVYRYNMVGYLTRHSRRDALCAKEHLRSK